MALGLSDGMKLSEGGPPGGRSHQGSASMFNSWPLLSMQLTGLKLRPRCAVQLLITRAPWPHVTLIPCIRRP